MLTGNLPPASNRASWVVNYELSDIETGELIDLSGVEEITLVVRDGNSPLLTGTKTGGQIVVTDMGVFTWSFTDDQMRALCSKTYEVGCTITGNGETVQLIIGQLPVLDGVVT